MRTTEHSIRAGTTNVAGLFAELVGCIVGAGVSVGGLMVGDGESVGAGGAVGERGGPTDGV